MGLKDENEKQISIQININGTTIDLGEDIISASELESILDLSEIMNLIPEITEQEEELISNEDMKCLLCLGLAANPAATKYINKIYKSDINKYDNYAKNSNYYDRAQQKTLIEEIYYKRALGILESKEEENIDYLIRMSFKDSNKFVKNNKVINLDNFNLKRGGINNFFGHFYAVLYLAKKSKKIVNTNDEIYEGLMNVALRHLNGLRTNEISEIYCDKHSKTKMIEIKDKLFKKYPDLKALKITILDKDLKDFSVREKFMELYPDIILLENIEKSSFYADITLKELEENTVEIIKTWFRHEDIENIDVDKVDYEALYMFVYTGLYLRLILKRYKEAKKYYFDNVGVIEKEKIEAKDKEVSKIKQELIELQAKYDKLEKKYDRDTEKLKNENKKLKNKNNELEKTVATYPDTKEELTELRNLMFNLSEEDNIDNTVVKNTVDLDKLNSLKAICIGGTNSWIASMKEVLPNWIYVAAGVENYDTRLLKGKEYIFINTKANIHGMYYKAIENKDKKTKLKYINSLNRDRVLKEIEENL